MCVRGGYLEEDLIRDPVGLRRYVDSSTHAATQNLMPSTSSNRYYTLCSHVETREAHIGSHHFFIVKYAYNFLIESISLSSLPSRQKGNAIS
jgi:hypothetical protein